MVGFASISFFHFCKSFDWFLSDGKIDQTLTNGFFQNNNKTSTSSQYQCLVIHLTSPAITWSHLLRGSPRYWSEPRHQPERCIGQCLYLKNLVISGGKCHVHIKPWPKATLSTDQQWCECKNVWYGINFLIVTEFSA